MQPQNLQLVEQYIRSKQDGLSMFRALSPDFAPGYPDQVSFFESQASECLVRGGNRSSKSTSCAVKFAAIARDKPVHTIDGREIDCRYPWQKGRPLVMWVIGYQLNHIGQTIHRLLFRPGLYKIIPDEHTGVWRAFRPWDPVDAAREMECKPSWPLIPASEIAENGWAWEAHAQNVFYSVTLKNGTVIYAFASTGEVKTGDPVDVIWIDEAIAYPEHYPEWQMRIPDKKGRIFWSSWPRKGNPALLRLTERAKEQQEELERGERDEVNVEEFVFTFSGNPYIDSEEKAKVNEGLTEEELVLRDKGEYNLEQSLIYPTFDPQLHAAVPDNPMLDDEIAKILRENDLTPPPEWTHELILDPGTVRPAVLFAAVPPRELWGGNEPVLVAYQEIYRPRLTAEDIAKKCKELKPPAVWFRRFIIDGQAARQKPMGFAKTIGQNYSDHFDKQQLTSFETGSGFAIGDPDFLQCRMKVESALALRDNGTVRLRIVVQRCPNLVWQMANNQLKVTQNEIQDKEADRQRNDVRKCLEYWVSRNPTYVPVPRANAGEQDMYQQFLQWKKEIFGTGEKDRDHVLIGPAA